VRLQHHLHEAGLLAVQSREEFRTFDERRHAADKAGEIDLLLGHEADRLGVATGRGARALQADLPRDDLLQRQFDQG
jgi:hypothetical protein